MSSEQNRLDDIAESNNYNYGINEKMIIYTANLFKRFMKDGSVLEMGPAHGIATNILYPSFPDYAVVDAARVFVDQIIKTHPEIRGYISLFEDFTPQEKFDNILMSHVLEHVLDPVYVLKKCKTWKKSGGVVCIAVPNCKSLHRIAGVKLGLINDLKELHMGDHKIGHRRVYDLETLKKDCEEAGLKVKKSGGYWLKPVSNSQIENTWSDELVQAYMEIGEEFPDIACNIYVIAE